MSGTFAEALVAGLTVVLTVAAAPASSGAEVLVRVRVAQSVRAVELSGSGLRVASRPVAAGRLRASADGASLVAGSVVSQAPIRVAARSDLELDGRPVPGELVLVARGESRLDVVNLVPLEAYVARIVAGEVYADWPSEALRAQAVAARTYVMHERARNAGVSHDVDSTVLSQRYVSGDVSPRLLAATLATRDQYLEYGGVPILAAFHSSAGGHTASAEEVWGRPLPYLRSVSSPDGEAPHYFWSYEIDVRDLDAALRDAGYGSTKLSGSGADLRVLSRTPSGRVSELRIGQVSMSGRELRQVLGGGAIRSALFDVRIESAKVRFLGSGSGHGVGLCQWGAHEMARAGRTYREILSHYYPGTTLRRLISSADARRSPTRSARATGGSALH